MQEYIFMFSRYCKIIKSKGHLGRGLGAENGFNKIETPSEDYLETYFADSSLSLDLYFN